MDNKRLRAPTARDALSGGNAASSVAIAGQSPCMSRRPPASRRRQLDANLKSFAQMAVAAQVGCSFCLDFGYFHAHNEGLDEAKASEVPPLA